MPNTLIARRAALAAVVLASSLGAASPEGASRASDSERPVVPVLADPAPRITDAVVGLIDVIQNDNSNENESVTLTVPNGAILFSFTKQNRGDYHLGFGTGDDLNNGVVIVSPRDRLRTNTTGGNLGGNRGGDSYATISINRDIPARTQYAAVHGSPSGDEMNLNLAAAFFPFDRGFIAGHATNGGINNGTLTEIVASPGIQLGSGFIDPAGTSGIYTLDLAPNGFNADDGVLLVNHAKNEDNFALSRAEPDGTFTIYCKDNGNDAGGFENDPVAFVFLPFETPGLVAGRVAENSGAAPSVLDGTGGFEVFTLGVGRVGIRILGVRDAHAGALLVSPQGGETNNQDNFLIAEWSDTLDAYIVETIDIGTGVPEAMGGEPMLSFAYLPITPGFDGFAPREGTQTLVAIPDTQFYAQSFPDTFNTMMQWIVDETPSRDIRMAMHMGDITDNNNTLEWSRSLEAIGRLNNTTPYILAQGNHDVGPGGNAADRSTRMNDYFPVSVVSLQPTFGGTLEPGRVENSYSLFDWGGRDWIVIALEWSPRDATLAWAGSILDQHADRDAIVITHAYMHRDERRMDHLEDTFSGSPYSYGTASDPGGVNDGGDIWRGLITQHDNVRMVLSGHITGDGILSSTTPLGNTVHQMLVDYQSLRFGGDGFLRYYEIVPGSNTVRARTFSPKENRYKTGPTNHFEFELDPAPAPLRAACAADLTGDGVLDERDLDAYIRAWRDARRSADLNADGACTFADLSRFLGALGAGCP